MLVRANATHFMKSLLALSVFLLNARRCSFHFHCLINGFLAQAYEALMKAFVDHNKVIVVNTFIMLKIEKNS
jgi:hypothetical protein